MITSKLQFAASDFTINLSNSIGSYPISTIITFSDINYNKEYDVDGNLIIKDPLDYIVVGSASYFSSKSSSLNITNKTLDILDDYVAIIDSNVIGTVISSSEVFNPVVGNFYTETRYIEFKLVEYLEPNILKVEGRQTAINETSLNQDFTNISPNISYARIDSIAGDNYHQQINCTTSDGYFEVGETLTWVTSNVNKAGVDANDKATTINKNNIFELVSIDLDSQTAKIDTLKGRVSTIDTFSFAVGDFIPTQFDAMLFDCSISSGSYKDSYIFNDNQTIAIIEISTDISGTYVSDKGIFVGNEFIIDDNTFKISSVNSDGTFKCTASEGNLKDYTDTIIVDTITGDTATITLIDLLAGAIEGTFTGATIDNFDIDINGTISTATVTGDAGLFTGTISGYLANTYSKDFNQIFEVKTFNVKNNTFSGIISETATATIHLSDEYEFTNGEKVKITEINGLNVTGIITAGLSTASYVTSNDIFSDGKFVVDTVDTENRLMSGRMIERSGDINETFVYTRPIAQGTLTNSPANTYECVNISRLNLNNRFDGIKNSMIIVGTSDSLKNGRGNYSSVFKFGNNIITNEIGESILTLSDKDYYPEQSNVSLTRISGFFKDAVTKNKNGGKLIYNNVDDYNAIEASIVGGVVNIGDIFKSTTGVKATVLSVQGISCILKEIFTTTPTVTNQHGAVGEIVSFGDTITINNITKRFFVGESYINELKQQITITEINGNVVHFSIDNHYEIDVDDILTHKYANLKVKTINPAYFIFDEGVSTSGFVTGADFVDKSGLVMGAVISAEGNKVLYTKKVNKVIIGTVINGLKVVEARDKSITAENELGLPSPGDIFDFNGELYRILVKKDTLKRLNFSIGNAAQGHKFENFSTGTLLQMIDIENKDCIQLASRPHNGALFGVHNEYRIIRLKP